jgi:hypothetical protein
MNLQRTDEWLQNYEDDYFNRQFVNPYRSTVAICNWLQTKNILNENSKSRIIDIATGKGANLSYFTKVFPNSEFLGLDFNKSFVESGNNYFKNNNNCQLEYGDIYKLDKKHIGIYDGLTCLQTLSWLPNFKEPLLNFMNLNPQWILLSSLFYEGNINCKIEIEQYEKSLDAIPRLTYYNIYSLPMVKEFCAENGYKNFHYIPFEIDIDLPKNKNDVMGTYTEELKNGKRIQISGPLLMNWYFILISK